MFLCARTERANTEKTNKKTDQLLADWQAHLVVYILAHGREQAIGLRRPLAGPDAAAAGRLYIFEYACVFGPADRWHMYSLFTVYSTIQLHSSISIHNCFEQAWIDFVKILQWARHSCSCYMKIHLGKTTFISSARNSPLNKRCISHGNTCSWFTTSPLVFSDICVTFNKSTY